MWSNVFSTEEDSSSDFGRDELRMRPDLRSDMKKASFRKLSNGADNGTRTRGLNLGKVALYQLSYVRKGIRREKRNPVGDVGIEPTTPSV